MLLGMRFGVLFFFLLVGKDTFPQLCDPRSGVPIQMQVQLTFSDQALDTPSTAATAQNDSAHRGDAPGVHRSDDFSTNAQIRVQLQDPLGGTLQEASPNSDGLLRMTVCRNGIYRLRVTGPIIEEAVLDDLHPGRGDKLLTVVLQHKLTAQGAKASQPMISTRQLAVPKRAKKQLDKANGALRRGNLEDAERYYTKAIKLYPDYAEAENNLGIVLMKQGRRSEGKAAFTRAVTINDHFASAYVNLAKIAIDDKRFSDAYVLSGKALLTEPLNPSALFVAAEAAFFTARYTETIAYARTIHSLPHTSYALVHYLAAKSLEAQNQPEAAINEYHTFLDEDPLDSNAKRARELLSRLEASERALQESHH